MSRKKFQNGNIFEVGNRIREVRGSLSQKKIGEILGVRASTISKYEAGRVPDSFVLKKIADHGGVTVEWLLQGEEPQKHQTREDLSLLSEPVLIPPGLVEPYLFAAVDKTNLADIIEKVEEGLKRKKRPLGSKKKAHLISLLYDEFQKTGQMPDQSTIQDFLKLVM